MLTNSSPRSLAKVSAALMTLYDAWLSWGAETLDPEAEGSAASAPADLMGEAGDVDPDGRQQCRGDALALLEQGVQQMQRLDLRIAVRGSDAHSGAERVLALGGELDVHCSFPCRPSCYVRCPGRHTTRAVDCCSLRNSATMRRRDATSAWSSRTRRIPSRDRP